MRFRSLALLLALHGCSCGEADTPLTLDGGAIGVGSDGAIGVGGDGAIDGDGAIGSGGDGAIGSGGDGAIGGGSDGALAGDGGDPLEQNLPAFCAGRGTVVVVGAADECAGDLAENTFRFALCACQDVAVQSNLTLDGFDSRLGPYAGPLPGGGTNVLDDGQLGTNAPLEMDGKLDVRGSAFVGRGFSVGAQSSVLRSLYSAGTATQTNASSSVGGNAFIRGDVVGRYTIGGDLRVPVGASVSGGTRVTGQTLRGPIPVVEPCACSPSELIDVGALTRFGATHNDNAVRGVLTATTWASPGGPARVELPCGRYYVERIVTSGGLTLHATGRVVLFVDGDMTIGGGLTVSTASAAEVDLFVAGSLSVQAAARIGSEARPAAVRTYVGGADDIVLSASTVFGGFVYAPRARVVFGASAELFGGLFARRVDMSGSARVHYDHAVRSAGESCEEPTDGGPAGDAATPAGDAGGAVTDGGAGDGGAGDGGAGDGGASGGDGGGSGVGDAGGAAGDASPRPDAGPAPSGCACQAQCGTQACVEGQCVTCMSDLDCCAPLTCNAGLCTINL